MTITVRPGTASDAPAISRVHHNALLKYHTFYSAFFEMPIQNILPLSNAAALKDPVTRYIVAVCGEEIVGFVRFEVLDGIAKEEKVGGNSTKRLFTPKNYMKDLWTEFCTHDAEKEFLYSESFQSKKHIYIKHLMVLPTNQNQGVGTALMRALLQESDGMQIPTCLVSSAEGVRLYQKVGFQGLTTWRIDNELWAGKIVERMKEAGEQDKHNLVEAYRGVDEVETYMIRWPEVVEAESTERSA